MSYSRWSNSTWYTFWRSGEENNFAFPTMKRKRAQVFEICDFPSYQITYGELMDKGILQVLREVKVFYAKEHTGEIASSYKDGFEVEYSDRIFEPKNPTGSELVELSGYIAQFEKDVDEEFTLTKYFKNLWEYKIKQEIIRICKN
jgi:hypothetical protein